MLYLKAPTVIGRPPHTKPGRIKGLVLAVAVVATSANSQSVSEALGPSSRRTPIAITEIMYKPASRTDGRNMEFIELYNSNP